MIDLNLLLVYNLIIISSICILGFISWILCLLMKIMKKNRKDFFRFLEYIIPGIFGGLIASIILEIKTNPITNKFVFTTITIPLTTLLTLIFFFMGLSLFLVIKYYRDKIKKG